MNTFMKKLLNLTYKNGKKLQKVILTVKQKYLF